MRNILIAEALFTSQIKRVLNRSPACESGESRKRTIRVCKSFRPCISGKHVQSTVESTLRLCEQRVICRLSKVFQTAIRVDVAVLRERTQSLRNGSREAWVRQRHASSSGFRRTDIRIECVPQPEVGRVYAIDTCQR